jgi:hypothetical protein
VPPTAAKVKTIVVHQVSLCSMCQKQSNCVDVCLEYGKVKRIITRKPVVTAPVWREVDGIVDTLVDEFGKDVLASISGFGIGKCNCISASSKRCEPKVHVKKEAWSAY